MSDLHIPNLTIKNFRGIDELEIPKFGRVTLLVGKNGVGKTTILDAIRIYASRGDYSTFHRLLVDRNELERMGLDGERGIAPFAWRSLFNKTSEPLRAEISVDNRDGSDPLWIEQVGPGGVEERARWTNASREALRIRFRNGEREMPYIVTGEAGHHSVPVQAGQLVFHVDGSRTANLDWNEKAIPCESIGPDLMKNHDIAKLWDNIALSPAEDTIIEALKITLQVDIERAALVSDGQSSRDGIGRYIIVRQKDADAPVPLRSLGDGATRFFGIALAISASSGGLILIDEIENGMHYSILKAFWALLFRLAREYQVQIIATTHSWDSVHWFASVATEDTACRAFLYRLDREGDALRAVQYREEKLMAAARYRIEVR